jgi:hypothetical protein
MGTVKSFSYKIFIAGLLYSGLALKAGFKEQGVGRFTLYIRIRHSAALTEVHNSAMLTLSCEGRLKCGFNLLS